MYHALVHFIVVSEHVTWIPLGRWLQPLQSTNVFRLKLFQIKTPEMCIGAEHLTSTQLLLYKWASFGLVYLLR